MSSGNRLLYFSTGDGADLVNEAYTVPVSRLRSIQPVDDTHLDLIFEPNNGGVSYLQSWDNIRLTINTDKHLVVTSAINDAINNSGKGLILICDKDNNSFVHSDVTDCTISMSMSTTPVSATFSFPGYSNVASANVYEYAVALTDGQSPNQYSTAHNAAVTGATLDVGDFHKVDGIIMPEAGALIKVVGWGNNATNSATTTIAICKITPVAGNTSAVTPSVVHEVTYASDSSTSLDELNFIQVFGSGAFTAPSFAKGDKLFLMVKSSGTGNLWFNLTLEVEYKKAYS